MRLRAKGDHVVQGAAFVDQAAKGVLRRRERNRIYGGASADKVSPAR